MNCRIITFTIDQLAHVCGYTGKNTRSGRINTIVGLDPAGPLFNPNDPNDRLDSSDAEYVEIIHTDSTGIGIGVPIGHADFYPNGGTGMPGCPGMIGILNTVAYPYH